MIYAGNQPYFLPYIGYWQLIKCADVFALSDDYNYKIDGWIHRNRILNNGEPLFFGLNIKGKSPNKLINELDVMRDNFPEKLKTIERTYRKAPHYEQGSEIIKKIFAYEDSNLAEFLFNSHKIICDYLDIKTPLVKTSSLEGNNQYKREFRIYDQCKRLGADTYINAIGGMELYDFEQFEKEGLTLKFINSHPRAYKQFKNEFVPNLSILDVIMFNAQEEVIAMLDDYELISAPGK